MNERFKKHYNKSMELLDMLNELISDISWTQSEEELDESEYSLLDSLYNDLCDVESELSDKLYNEETYEREEQ